MIKHLSLFSGLGGATSALKQAGIKHETIAISEVEPKSLKVYKAIHGKVGPANEGDIIAFSKDVDRLKFYTTNEKPYLITAGFPCQPFSMMNLKKKADIKDDVRYQAALAMRSIVKLLQPPYVMLENVKAITNKNFWPQIKEFLDGFGYHYLIHFDNPIQYGYHQSRGRNYILMTRPGMPMWNAGNMVNRKRAFHFDENPDASQFYKIYPTRVKSEVSILEPRFGCLAARSCDAHCSRFTWIPYQDGHRSPTPNELFQLFGYTKYPKLTAKRSGGIARGSFFHAFGNSWHIGHAASHLKTLPLP
jgi:site-specific DNA-cytosine methylase